MTIEIYLSGQTWMTYAADPERLALFGTYSLPTPYRAATPAGTVLAQIQHRNPEHAVILR